MATGFSPARLTEKPPDYRDNFKTKEGVYQNSKMSTYSRPTKAPYFSKQSFPVHFSLVRTRGTSTKGWIAFNVGKELYCYEQCKTGQRPDLAKPVDKHIYKGTFVPVCHDFNQMTTEGDRLDLLVGFSSGAIQHLNPLKKESLAVFNDDGSIDNTQVTCIKWVPGCETMFVTGHRSGHIYLWDTECKQKISGTKVQFGLTKELESERTKIYTCRSKQKCQILEKWSVGHGSVNELSFSPDCTHLAVVSQDGYLRVYNFKMHELYGKMRSYFGALLCVCWSPDGNYIVTGGEDDMVNVWSFQHRKIIARGEGHKSWINAVAFDPYTSSAGESTSAETIDIENELRPRSSSIPKQVVEERKLGVISYRFGSVGQDTHILLWELSGDALKLRRPFTRLRSYRRDSKFLADQSISQLTDDRGDALSSQNTLSPSSLSVSPRPEESVSQGGSVTQESETQSPDSQAKNESSLPVVTVIDTHLQVNNAKNLKERSVSPSGKKKGRSHKDKKFPRRLRSMFVSPSHHRVNSAGSGFGEFTVSDDTAPKMSEVNLVEPLVNKKIWSERLTALCFREDCLLVATQDGFIQCWTRPDGSECSDSPDEVTSASSDAPSSQSHKKEHVPYSFSDDSNLTSTRI